MIWYFKLGRVRGMSVEIAQHFGLKPFFRRNSFDHETIVDISYVQIIYTSGRWRKKERVQIRSAANGNKETSNKEIEQITRCSKRVNSDRC